MADPQKNEDAIIIEEEVLEILRQALIEEKEKTREGRDTNKEDLNETLDAILKEFVGCYRLFGYDFDGNIVDISHISTPMENSAMNNLFVHKFGEFMAERGGVIEDDRPFD